MKNFWRIYQFEQKKLLQKTYVRLALAFIIAITLFLNCYPLGQKNEVAYVDDDDEVIIKEVNYYQEVQLERRFAKAYNGKLLTNEIVDEVRDVNERYKEYTSLDEDAFIPLMNMRLPYGSVANLGLNPCGRWENRADKAYEHMFECQDEHLKSLSISIEEMQYWQQQKESQKIPLTMYYAQGYYQILDKSYLLNILGLLFTILCLCSAFSEEIACHTDSMVRASRFGTMRLSMAKLAAGESIAGMTILLLFTLTAVIQFAVHGIGGWKAPIQLQGDLDYQMLLERCGTFTMGEAVLSVIVISLLMVMMVGIITMLLSKVCRHNIPAIAIPFCILLIPFFVRTQKPMFQQIFSYFPFQRLKVGEFLLDMRLVKIFGKFLNAAEMSILLYGGLTVLFLGISILICKVTVKARK